MLADIAHIIFVQTPESGLARGAPVDRFGLRESLRGCFLPSLQVNFWPLKQRRRVNCRQVSYRSNEKRISQLNGRDQWGVNGRWEEVARSLPVFGFSTQWSFTRGAWCVGARKKHARMRR